MRIVRGASADGLARGGVVTIGNYDGLHRGQRAVVDRVVERAGALGVAAVVVTFDPHPLAVLAPARAPRRIASDAQRQRQLEAAGVTDLWVLPFDENLARVPAEAFVERHLVGELALRELIVGSRFAFGAGRRGDLALLRAMGARLGFEAAGVEEIQFEGRPVSSTRIREALGAGDVEEAARLLGRPFALEGRVVEGEKLGRQLGWPTANLAPATELLPALGVYASRLRLLGEDASRDGVTNVGVRPTRAGDGLVHVETHLFDFEGDLYGRVVELELHRRLRGERRFPSLEALSAQIAADAAAAREYFGGAPRFDESIGGGSRPPGSGSDVSSPRKDDWHGE